ncbi:hypothetical protein T08_11859 [Trichinella sp. T8]|nr:hypothetical protein T08_11859 [Trichinella sp. T8]
MKKAKASDWESFKATVAFRRPLPLLMFRNERDMNKLSRFTSSLMPNDCNHGFSLHYLLAAFSRPTGPSSDKDISYYVASLMIFKAVVLLYLCPDRSLRTWAESAARRLDRPCSVRSTNIAISKSHHEMEKMCLKCLIE